MSHAPIPLVLIGAGGHAKVVLALAQAAGFAVVGVCDPALAGSGATHWRGIPVLGDDAALARFTPGEIGLANGIGQVPGSTQRQQLFERLAAQGHRFPPLAHPRACIDASSTLREGAQVMAGAVVQADCVIGANSLVNSAASVDHDCLIGAHVHIAPGAVLCGGVQVGEGAFIGAGATVLPAVRIGPRALVAAAAVLARHLAAGAAHLPHRQPHRHQEPQA